MRCPGRADRESAVPDREVEEEDSARAEMLNNLRRVHRKDLLRLQDSALVKTLCHICAVTLFKK